ncbi:glutathione S-transferase family protein [Aeromonas dhakensis]|uniref:glutathione S-transferase family protein n=1 Tax=Aeromonas dhakensis TaxID=196024 RepID=UPI0018A73A1B|nr:glutathione S-transferase family protein [Aeromonas dhakensis]MBF8449707.1 glutathione S-transferase family protein [Aeromonas dhakensis]MED7773126.1 glutathione S-transferase family protein [Aeromonas dhakensis]UNU87804.1 glutathione S-transferase family protein [Aeromonas dhakensis]
MKLYAHPFSSYSQKVLIALYENATPFDYRNLEELAANTELAALWPLKRFPVLLDDGRCILESSTIVAHLQAHHPGPICLIPPGDAGLEVHMLDRVFDNYVMTPMQKVVLDALRPAADRDRYGVVEARELLDQIYLWLDQRLEGRHWIAGAGFTLADCAAAPSLFYADWAHEIPAGYGRLRAYRARLLSHPSIVRVVDEARPFRHYFPLGAPARD